MTSGGAPVRGGLAPRLPARLRIAAPAWERSLRDAALAYVLSRLLVVLPGALAAGVLGLSGKAPDFDPAGATAVDGAFGDALLAPHARWDSVWLLAIADGGYGEDPARPAFFPLYPLLARLVGAPAGSSLAGGIVVSAIAFAVALVVLHRLAERELGSATAARWAVLACALFPTAFFHGAVYSEGLFLALSVGAVYAARTGSWAWAGTLGAFAATTRSAGIVLVVPLLLLHLEERRVTTGSWRPSSDGAWIALVPAGLLAVVAFFGLSRGDPRAPFDAQEVWMRELTVPFSAVWDGAVAAFEGARQLLSGAREPVYFTPAGGDPFVVAQDNLILFAFLVLALVAVAGTLRRLPLPYGAYLLAALALPLSAPVAAQPLMSLPRFLAVLFPIFLWAGLALDRAAPRRAILVLGLSAGLLAVLAARFATWHWVA